MQDEIKTNSLEFFTIPSAVYEVADQFAIVTEQDNSNETTYHVQFARDVVTTEDTFGQGFTAKRQRRIFATVTMTENAAKKLLKALERAINHREGLEPK